MASNQALFIAAGTQELVFAGDGVRLAGQIDYPNIARPENGYPLLFILHHAGCNTRDCYDIHAAVALASGYAVFRWDKRGTGKSGAGGRGSTTQDAVNAYEVALDRENIDPRRVIILAQGSGSGLLGSAYGLFARVHAPYGVILMSSVLDEDNIVAIDSHLHVILSENDWNSPEIYGKKAVAAHSRLYKQHSASLYIAAGADRHLNDEAGNLHDGARKSLADWLRNAHPTSRLI